MKNLWLIYVDVFMNYVVCVDKVVKCVVVDKVVGLILFFFVGVVRFSCVWCLNVFVVGNDCGCW